MTVLVLGIALFLGAHVFATFRGARAAVIERFGLQTYKLAYSLVAATGLGMIVWGFSLYRDHGLIQLWEPPHWMRHVAMPLVLLAFIAIASRRASPGRIRGWLRHPTLVAIKAWALAHLLVNGDLGGMILFGAFLAFGVYDRIAVKRRGDEGAARVSTFTRGDAIAIGAGLALFTLVLVLHPLLFGVAVIPA